MLHIAAAMLSERYEGHVILGPLRDIVVPAVLIAVVVCELCLIVQLRRRKLSWPTFLIAQAFGFAFWFFGELKVNYLTRLGFGDRAPLPQFEQVTQAGDPNLADWVDSQTVLTPRPVFSDSATFTAWQTATRERLRRDMLGAAALEHSGAMHVVNERRIDSITRQLVTFAGFDGSPIPAYLFRPNGSGPHPAILVLSGSGHGIIETAGLIDSYQHSVALELARAGYVTFTPEYRGQGYLGERVGTDQCIVGYNALIGGSFYAALEARDLSRAVDVLSAMPFVDSTRLGVTGVSKGGLYSVITGALDPRIRVVVAQSTLIPTFVAGGGLRKSWNRRISPTAPSCNAVAGSRHAFGPFDLGYLIAPKPFLLSAGIKEAGMKRLQDAADSALRPAYAVLGRGDAFQRLDLDGWHEYFLGPAVDFFNRNLRPIRHGGK